MPELDEYGDPKPTSSPTPEYVQGLIDSLLGGLEQDPNNCEKFMSMYRVLDGYKRTKFQSIANTAKQQALSIHQGGRSLYSHIQICVLYVDPQGLFGAVRGDENN